MNSLKIPVLVLFFSAAVFAQDPADAPSQPPAAPAQDSKALPPEAEKLSDAEKIARLQRAIGETEKQTQEVIKALNDPESEYVKAQAAFQDIDAKHEAAKKNVETLKASGDAEMITAAEADLQNLEKQWSLARERFDLAIKQRKLSQEQMGTLEQKLKGDKEALAKLMGPVEPAPVTTSPKPADTGTVQPPDAQPPADPAAQTPPTQNGAAAPAQQPTTAPATTPQTTGTVAPTAGLLPPAAQPATQPAAPPEAAAKKPESKEVKQAQQEVAKKETAAQAAEEEARSIEERIAQLQESIKTERELMLLARKKSDNAAQTEDALSEDLQRQWENKATWTETKPLRDQIDEQKSLQDKARAEVRERTDRIDALQAQLTSLQNERIAAMEEAERKRGEAEKARVKLEALENPFTLPNLLGWLLAHGPKILGILVGMIVLLLLARVFESRVVPIMARHGRGGASIEDRENRAKTLMSVFHNTARVVVIIGGCLMLLAEVGLNIVPLITAAGIAGLAIAFGAQNLIRDYFYGFTILIESQYTVNDVVRIAGIAGMVERITLRITVLRDLEGVVHFVPHGEVKTVSNMTHGWSRALFDIGIAYKENADQVMKVLVDLGKELRRDPEYSAFVLDDPEMLGVDQFGDSAVMVKFLIKTRPLKQWMVKREMLRRIKNKFDELGIEIPFPHRTVYHRHESENGAEEHEQRLAKWEEGAYAKK